MKRRRRTGRKIKEGKKNRKQNEEEKQNRKGKGRRKERKQKIVLVSGNFNDRFCYRKKLLIL